METGQGGAGRLRFSLDIRPLQMSSRYQGTGVYCYNLVRHLMRADPGNEYLLFQRRKRPWRAFPYPPNFRPFHVRRGFDQDQRFLPFLDQVLTPWNLWRMRPDLHHVFSIHYACAWLPCPTVVTIHDVIPLIYPQFYTRTGLKHRLLYAFARRADHILTPSESARRDVHRLLGIPLERMTVTYEAADDRFRPPERWEDVEEVARQHGIDGPYILYVGGFTKLDPRKNVKQLVEVFRELRRQGFEGHRLVLAGKCGEYSEALLREMGTSVEEEGVVFTDYVNENDLPLLYGGARCFVYPSSYEGFGLPPLEAISCGTPTVVYRNSSFPEVLGEGGILVDEEDPRQLLEAVRSVLSQEGLARTLREKGLKQAARFTWEAAARGTLAVYREVCARRGRNPRA